MYDFHASSKFRTMPLQARGKERVRRILAAAHSLYKQQAPEDITTNDIASAADITIGSLYRYFPNKAAIVQGLTERYVGDVAAIFTEIARHPMLRYMSWDETLSLMVDGWVNYSLKNGPFNFLYAERAKPSTLQQDGPYWQHFYAAFTAVITKRCKYMTDRQLIICFQLCRTAVELGTNEYYRSVGVGLYHEAVGAVGAYMLHNCKRHHHETAGVSA